MKENRLVTRFLFSPKPLPLILTAFCHLVLEAKGNNERVRGEGPDKRTNYRANFFPDAR